MRGGGRSEGGRGWMRGEGEVREERVDERGGRRNDCSYKNYIFALINSIR